eukprot:TRINITY_DN18671_c0_g1_i1.p2 TRINITY_DN18671_c0_g1~~TRINITY_DN18671_c0_g1_i1.p2  ORF type:complete len:513 (+),score=126.04 TRINITY_DN18671_c0_g1_i1:65-1603(+)
MQPAADTRSGQPGKVGSEAKYAIYKGSPGEQEAAAMRGSTHKRPPGTPEGPAVWESYAGRRDRGSGDLDEGGAVPRQNSWGLTPVAQRQTADALKRASERVFRFTVPHIAKARDQPTGCVLRVRREPPDAPCLLYVDDLRSREATAAEPAPPDYRWMRHIDATDGEVEMAFGDAEGKWLVAVFARAPLKLVEVELVAGVRVDKMDDFQQPWRVCAQEIWSLEQQELLDQWFVGGMRDVFVAETREELIGSDGSSPLHFCCKAPQKGAVRWARELTTRYGRFLDTEARDSRRRSALHYACSFPDDASERDYARAAALVRYLVKEVGMAVNVVDDEGETPLHCICRSDAPPSALVELLLRRGATVRVNKLAQTPQQAARLTNNNHNAACVELWLSGCLAPDEAAAERLRQLRQQMQAAEGGADDSHLAPLEDNIGELLLSDRQLRREFAKYDPDGNGFIEVAEFRKLESKMVERHGIGVGESLIESLIQKYNLIVDGRVSYKAFALLMLKLPQF